MKYLGIYLPKETKDLYIENYKTLVHPVDCSLPGSSIHGILQARVLEWVAIAFYGKKSKRTVIDGEIYHVHGSEESI